jgi:tRNA 2-thiouridine synthesizing protein A
MTIQITTQIDARGLTCPMPILKAAKAMKELASGGIVEVVATDPGSVKDFAAWSRTRGHALIESSTDGAEFRFVLRKR